MQLTATNWPELAGAIICAPSLPTCGARILDYFAVKEGTAHAVRGVALVEDSTFEPHSAVRLYLEAAPRRLMVRKLASARKLGPELPYRVLGEGADARRLGHSP